MASNNSNNKKKNIKLASKIFFEYGDFIHSIIISKVQDEDKASDLCQDLFLSLVQNPIPPEVANIKGLLYRAIINDIADAHRRVERYKKHIKKYGQKMKYSINKSHSTNAFKEKEEIIKMLELIHEQLPMSCAQAIMLRYGDNLSVKEVAKKMNVKIPSVRRYLSTGLKILRQLLTGK